MFFEFNNKTNTIIKLDDIQYVEKNNGTYNNILIQLKKSENLCYIGYNDKKSRDKDYERLKQELLPTINVEETPFDSYLFTKDYNSNKGTIYAGSIGEVKRVETHTTKSDVVIVDGEVIFEIGSANAKKYGRPICK